MKRYEYDRADLLVYDRKAGHPAYANQGGVLCKAESFSAAEQICRALNLLHEMGKDLPDQHRIRAYVDDVERGVAKLRNHGDAYGITTYGKDF